LLQMQEDIQGILPKGKAEPYHSQTFWTNVSFRVSARALVKKQKEKERVDWQKRGYSLCRAKLAPARD
jgi:hypothetical protein